MSKCQSCGVNEEKAVKQSRTVTNAQEENEDCEGHSLCGEVVGIEH